MTFVKRKKKNNSAGTSHQGFPWSFLLGLIALKGKKAFFMLVLSLPNKEPSGVLGICHCIRPGILCGFLLLSSRRSSPAVFTSWYQSYTLSGYLLNPEIPEPPRSPSSEGKVKHQKTLQKQGIPPLPSTSTGPDNLEVRRGAPLLDQTFSKAMEGVIHEDNLPHVSNGPTSWDHAVPALGKKNQNNYHLNFQVHSYRNTFEINAVIALIADKFLLNTLNNLVLHFKTTSLISTSVLHWREAPLGTKPNKRQPTTYLPTVLNFEHWKPQLTAFLMVEKSHAEEIQVPK